jgi:hypothetical protein
MDTSNQLNKFHKSEFDDDNDYIIDSSDLFGNNAD